MNIAFYVAVGLALSGWIGVWFFRDMLVETERDLAAARSERQFKDECLKKADAHLRDLLDSIAAAGFSIDFSAKPPVYRLIPLPKRRSRK